MRPTLIIPATLLAIAVALLVVPTSRAQSIIANGNFANPGDPLKGWIVDYAWAGNSNYMTNKDHVSVAVEGGRNVVKFGSAAAEGTGVKMESRAFPLEPGFKYICNLDIKGGGYRVYFAGYQWAPGVHPHDNPELGELRMIYQSKALNAMSENWKQEKLEIPGVALSEQAIEHLKKVRFLTVYIWMAKPGAVGSVNVTKVADPAMNLQ